MKVSILQWNVWGAEDIRNIVEFLQKNKADVICLQELTINYPGQFIKRTPHFVGNKLNYNYFYKGIAIPNEENRKMWLANGIFSKYKINSKSYFYTDTELDELKSEKRAYVEVELGLPNKTLTVGTIHMTYTNRFEQTPEKMLEADVLIKYISNKQRPFIVTGDLNSHPGSYTINKFENYFSNIGPDFKKNTWTTKPFSYNGFEENDLNWRLDHIFATSDIKLISSEVLTTQYSDHLPILSIVEV